MKEPHTWTQRSPFGALLISAGPSGVHSVELTGKRRRDTPLDPGAPKSVREISAAFERYFQGDAHALDVIPVDLSAVRSEFRRTVLATLHKLVGPGETITYGELAMVAGRPGAARAVGSTMANNPAPIIVPCHRVLASDGTLGGYGGGLDMKRALLHIEGSPTPAREKRRAR